MTVDQIKNGDLKALLQQTHVQRVDGLEAKMREADLRVIRKIFGKSALDNLRPEDLEPEETE